jgi:hypothetical protein
MRGEYKVVWLIYWNHEYILIPDYTKISGEQYTEENFDQQK